MGGGGGSIQISTHGIRPGSNGDPRMQMWKPPIGNSKISWNRCRVSVRLIHLSLSVLRYLISISYSLVTLTSIHSSCFSGTLAHFYDSYASMEMFEVFDVITCEKVFCLYRHFLKQNFEFYDIKCTLYRHKKLTYFSTLEPHTDIIHPNHKKMKCILNRHPELVFFLHHFEYSWYGLWWYLFSNFGVGSPCDESRWHGEDRPRPALYTKWGTDVGPGSRMLRLALIMRHRLPLPPPPLSPTPPSSPDPPKSMRPSHDSKPSASCPV